MQHGASATERRGKVKVFEYQVVYTMTARASQMKAQLYSLLTHDA